MSSNSIGILNSALQVNKKKMDIAMQNIANADNPNYSAKVVDISSIVTGDSPQGVQIDAIRSNYDDLLQRNLFSTNASAKSTEYISGKCKEITDKLALPGKNEGLFKKLSEFSDAITTLSYNSTNVSMRNDLQDKALSLTNYISNFAMYLQNERYSADHDLSNAFRDINNITSTLYSLNAKQMLFSDKTLEFAQIQDSIDMELGKLSQYFDIKYSKDDTGVLHVYLKNSGQEIVGKQIYHFEYNQATSVNQFIDDSELNPVYLVSKSVGGKEENRTVFISGNKTSDLTYNLSAGAIDGYLQMRDVIIPRVSETIDEIAVKIAKAFNEIHNKGSGSQPVTALNGTVLCKGSDKIIGNGNLIINPIDSQGKPVSSGAYGKIPALNLDLSKFSTNGVNGSFNLTGLVDEINGYFQAASTGSRVSMDGIHTANLAVKSFQNNALELDFDLIAYSTKSGVTDVDFKVTNVNVSSGTATLSDANFIMTNGAHLRSGVNGGPKITLANPSNYPITVSVEIETTIDGVTKTGTVNYQITQPTQDELTSINGIVNKKFTPTTASGDATVLQATLNDSIIKASIVDVHGNAITDPDKEGFLKIETTQGNAGVTIDESTSTLVSFTNPEVKNGFSNAFGLNDAFVFKNGNKNVSEDTKNVAAFMQLNDSIKKSVNAFSVGKIEVMTAGEPFDAPGIFFGMGVGDTSLVTEYQKLRNKEISFDKTHDIDSKTSTIYNYAADIVSANNIRTINADITAQREINLREMLSGELAGNKGVNVDNEAILVIQYQKNYTIAAKFINTSNNLLQTLIDSL